MKRIESAGQRLLLAFPGTEQPSAEFCAALERLQPAGVTLFRHLNVSDPAQVRRLTADLQRRAAAAGLPRLLIAIDQEGGQLMAVSAGTPLPGNMALGATGSTKLARRAGEVLGRELAAMGINVDYAPCADVNINPDNPVVGVRSFGEEPELVGRLSAALVEGLQSQGVAATVKHFPGHGDTSSDSHHGLPSVPHNRARLEQVELPPFRAALRAGVKLVMSAHLALPAIDGAPAPPATLSPAILNGLLRQEMGFSGVIVSDAMDMGAITQGEQLGANAVRAAAAGIDLLLLTADPGDQQRVFNALITALASGALEPHNHQAALSRIAALRTWLTDQPPAPELDIIGCGGHQAVALEIARRATTLVRDQANLLPLRLRMDQRLGVFTPRPVNLTPADTSAHVPLSLAAALRRYHANVEEIQYDPDLPEADIPTLVEAVGRCDAILVGSLNACTFSGQAELIRQILGLGIPTIIAALRLPYDLGVFPAAPTYLCTYSILEPALQALAEAVFGKLTCTGRLPVSIPGLYRVGHYQAPAATAP